MPGLTSRLETESITLHMPIERVSAAFVNDLDALCKKQKGKHKLKVVLYDQTNEFKLNLVSTQRKVNADNDFVKELQKLGVTYKFNQ